MKRAALQRKTPLKSTSDRKPRAPWIPERKRENLSSMACCIEARIRAARMALHGRMVSGCAGRPEIHHLRDGQGLSERAPWWETIPLCPEHHRGAYSIHGRDRAQFRAAHGTEREMLTRVNATMPANVCGRKGE